MVSGALALGSAVLWLVTPIPSLGNPAATGSLAEWVASIAATAGILFAGLELRRGRLDQQTIARARQTSSAMSVFTAISRPGRSGSNSINLDVTNDGEFPIFKVQVRVDAAVMADQVQVYGSIPQHSSKSAVARVPPDRDDAEIVTSVRLGFEDVYGSIWQWTSSGLCEMVRGAIPAP